MRRGKPLARSTKPLKRTAFKPTPRNDYEKELDALRPLLAQRSQGRCEIGLPGCQGIAVHPHHRKRRSQGGLNELRNLLHACGHCHCWAHAHIAEAVALGILVPSWAPVGPVSEVQAAVRKYVDFSTRGM